MNETKQIDYWLHLVKRWSAGEMDYHISSYIHFPQFLNLNIEDMIQARDYESSVPWKMDCSLDLLVKGKTFSFFKKMNAGHEHLIGTKIQNKYCTLPYTVNVGPVAQSVQLVATGWMVRGSNPGGGARFSAPIQTGPGAQPASCTMGTGSFPGVKSGRGVTLTPHPLLVSWS